MPPLADTVAADVAHVSPETTVRLHTVEFGDPWDFEDVYGALHDFASAYSFAPEREDYLVHVTTGTHVAQICLFLLTESRHLPARLLQTAPPKRAAQGRNPGSYSLIDLDLSKYDRLASRFRQEHRDAVSFLKSGIETRSAVFNTLIEQIEVVAVASRAPMLLMGPTGAGKSRLAARIFELKKRRQQLSGAFVEVNCATLRGDAAMSALFGHVRGAFTGASHDRPGLLRGADKGLLLLDEIGELGVDEQAMLLRAIEDRTFLPVGADREVRSDFQLIAGTNRDLARRRRPGPLSRRPARADQHVDLPAARPGASVARTSSRTSNTSSPRRRAHLARVSNSIARRARASCALPLHPQPAGPAGSATSTAPCSAWQRWRRVGGSRRRWSIRKSRGCRRTGSPTARTMDAILRRHLTPERHRGAGPIRPHTALGRAADLQ